MSETIIVTGAGGFLGGHLIETLVKAGQRVIAATLSRDAFLKKCPAGCTDKVGFVEIDLTSPPTFETLVECVKSPCYLVHLGAYYPESAAQMGAYNAERSIATNVTGTYKLIKVLVKKLTGVCLASTIDVYGTPQSLPINEESNVSPETFYAASKLAMEAYAAAVLQGKLPLAIIRLSHVYGPRDPHPKVLQAFIKNINQGKPPVIYGDGSDLRDFIHVHDVVKVIAKIALLKKEGLLVTATGKSYSLRDIAKRLIELTGHDMAPIYLERRHARRDYVFDISKLQRELNFCSPISLMDGLKELTEPNTTRI